MKPTIIIDVRMEEVAPEIDPDMFRNVKRPDNWVRVCVYAAVLSTAFVVGVYLAEWLGLLGY